MRRIAVHATIAACVGLGASAGATPLRMDYCVTDIGGGQFEYKISITLDNNDGSWAPGHGFSWLIFGDAPSPGPSPLADFLINPASFPVGVFTELGSSSGGHNGPTFHPIWVPPGPPTSFIMNFWVPNAIGDKIEWTGTSATNLGQGQMLWSNLWSGAGSVAADFAVGNLVPCGGTCYPDCNRDGDLTVADFGCFQTEFVAGNMAYADCNQDGELTVADFGCYQTEFVKGCP